MYVGLKNEILFNYEVILNVIYKRWIGFARKANSSSLSSRRMKLNI